MAVSGAMRPWGRTCTGATDSDMETSVTSDPAMAETEVDRILRRAGEVDDDQIDLAETALALAALDRPRTGLEWYRGHLDQLTEVVRARAGDEADVDAAAEALQAVFGRHFGYAGDDKSYDDLQNANLMRVIDRRKGLPVALGILYITVARRLGWDMQGLNFPGHFLIRLEVGAGRAILDPFAGGLRRETPELRDLIKAMGGVEAELRPEYHQPVGNRAILFRLQNNRKTRSLQAGSAQAAMAAMAPLLLIDPHEPYLWRELGILHIACGNPSDALRWLQRFLDAGPERVEPALLHQAATLIQRLKSTLN